MELLIILAIFIVLFLIVWKIIKSLLKAAIIIFIIFFIFTTLLGFLLYNDFIELQTNIKTQPMLFLLEKDNQIIAGDVIEISKEPKQFTPINEKTINEYNILYSSKNIQTLKSNNYKLIIINYESLLNIIKDPIGIENQKITKQQLNEIITSNNPFLTTSNVFSSLTEQQIKTLLKTNDATELKSTMFAVLLGQIKDPTELIHLYQSKKITIYDETIIFITLKYIPENIIPAQNFA